MDLLATARQALSLLSRRHRIVLGLFLAAQAALAVLDLAGIVLVGVVVALATSTMNGTSSDPPSWLSKLPFTGSSDLNTALILGGVAAVLLVGKSILSFFVMRRTLKFMANRQAEVSGALAALLLSRNLLFLQARSSQETAYALTRGVNAVTLGVIAQFTIICSEVLVLGILTIGLAFIDPLVTLFTILFFGATVALLHRRLAAWAHIMGTRAAETEIASFASIQEAFHSYREISVSGRRGLYLDRFRDLRWTAAGVQANMFLLAMVSKYVFDIALVVGGGLLVLSQLLTRDLTVALSITAVFLVAASRMMPSLLRIQTSLINVKLSRGEAESTIQLAQELRAGAVSGHVDRGLLTPEMRRGLAGDHSGFVPSVGVTDVSLTYPGSTSPSLNSVSISVNSAGTVALVGPTGAGKSTLADVILGLLVPDAGTVTVNAMSPDEAVRRWPGAIAYVPQSIALVPGSIRENVALGIPDDLIDDDQVWASLQQAELDTVVAALPEGLAATVGEGGTRLSGGQRQRLGLARALYTQPQLIVLDEATSALDSETEAAITDTLMRLGARSVVIVIAHRLATVRSCDMVCYLDAGRLVATGTFDDVRSSVPAFDRQAGLLGI